MKTKLLLIPDKPDQERDAIASSWIRHNGEVLRISKFWEKPHIAKEQQVSIYGYDTFSLVLAQVLGLELIEPKDEFIGQLDERWVKRGIQILTLETIDQAHFPTFVKPVKPKTFQSAIYHDKKQFQNETKGIEKSEQLIVSDIIDITCEARAFILDNQLLDIAIYEGDSDLVLARTFLTDFLATYGKKLPNTYVVDLGFNPIDQWFVIEFNATWGAGLNGCNPGQVIKAIRAATIN